jgi:hypothetical protein
MIDILGQTLFKGLNDEEEEGKALRLLLLSSGSIGQLVVQM